MTEKAYLPEIDITLDFVVDDYSHEDVYNTKTILSENDFKLLRKFVVKKLVDRKYFECIIDGGSEEVRFGVISHKKVEGGFIVEGPIVKSIYDKNDENKLPGNDFKVNIENQVLKTKIINDRLIDFLIDKELMSIEEKEKILGVSRKDILEKYFDYNTF